MKKILSLSVAGVLAASLLAPSAIAGGKKQTVEGTIALPAPFTDDSGCYAGLHRRGAILSQENNNGLIGWHFDIDPKTQNKKFVLEATGQGTVDVDIIFYQKFGTVDDVVGDPGGAGAPASVSFATRAGGGEKGKVPKGFPKAIICVYGGAQGVGAGANFTYTAG